ncbi:MAG: DUF11 domain-containing protein [Acinetobacter sp.]|nr:DUF11 domain-containing protein [Acinetobacter sp.]MDN5555173.1 DUF11 domain-containing protein [Acinetobacter sp.]
MSMNLKTTKRNNLYLSIATVLGGFAFFATGTTHAAAPAAGTNISNIATASYVDGTSTTRTVTSNEVKTTVLKVGSFTLEQDRSATANPNGVVTLSHVLTNTGNGTDEFELGLLNVAGDDFEFSNIAIYLDANKDGVPDNNTNLMGQVITLNAGESAGLVVVGTTAATATADKSGQLELSAKSTYITVPADKTKTNTDTVKIVGGAVIQVTKSANVTAVTRGDTVTYELTYKNTGNADATNLTIEDILPAGVTYVDESARWSGQTAPLTDDANDETAAKYKYDSGKLTLVLASVPRNSTGKLTFQVTVNASAPAGKITNVATFDPDGPGTEIPQPTNPYDVTVQSTYVGTINDNKTDTYSDTQKDISVSTKDDLITTTAVQGSPILFGASSLTEDIWIHNLGNVTETYNISVNKSGLPKGSIVELLKSDGNTPLTDTNGDASVDSGPLASGGHLEISARITLPNGYTGPITAPGLDTILTITPVHGTLPDMITLRITDITASKVDLHSGKDKDANTVNVVEGEGPYNGATTVTTVTTKPGVAGTFPIAVTNGGSTADNYNFGTDQPLPPGWTVEYFVADSAGVCSSTKVTNTGAIQPNATAYFCAKVTPSTDATPANSQDIVFTINSPATGLTDKMKDRLVVEAVRGLSFLADQQGQVAPGGTIVYKHTLTNNGNVVEGVSGGSTLPFAITHDPSTSGFVTSVYVDKNNDGIADSTELVTGNDLTAWLEKTGGTTSAFDGLSPNESVSILVKVEAPSNATAGQADLSIVTITPTGELNSIAAPAAVTVTDKTTVNIGQVRLEKLQALDADCNGAEEGNFGTSTLQAKPGACIIYQIKAVNDGNQAVTKVVITDAVPSYTTLGSTPAAALDPVSKGSVSNTANNLKSAEFALAPSETVTMKFSVKVDGQ